MKLHLTSSAKVQERHKHRDRMEPGGLRTRSIGGTALSERAHAGHLGPAGARAWRHTLILTGSLEDGSARELEEELECLYQEGVTIITLDLRQLEAIDAAGVMMVASCGSTCTLRGQAFAVVTGQPPIQRALADGGAGHFLVLEPPTRAARRFSREFSDDALSEMSTATTKSL